MSLFRKRGPKQGQITMFVIIGIVILFALAFAIYITTMLKTKPPVVQVENQPTDKRICLEKAGELAVQTIALYGGLPGPQITAGNSQLVRIDVAASNPLVDPSSFVLGRTNLGVLQMNPLCLRRGPNGPNAAGDGTNSCQQGTYQITEPDDAVVQYAFARIVEQHTTACGLTGTARVTFGLADITVQQDDVSVALPIRFKRVYNAARVLAAADVKDVLYDKRSRTSVQPCDEPANYNECLLPGMTMTSRQIPDSGGATLVQITDTKSSVLSEPLVWRFAIENRPPMIYQYPRQQVTARLGETRALAVPVLSADPDEQPLTVTCEPSELVDCTTTTSGIVSTTVLTLHPDCADYTPGQEVLVKVTADDGALKTITPFTVKVEGTCS